MVVMKRANNSKVNRIGIKGRIKLLKKNQYPSTSSLYQHLIIQEIKLCIVWEKKVQKTCIGEEWVE